MLSSVSAWQAHWPATRGLFAVYESRCIQSPVWRIANIASGAVVLVCALRAFSDHTNGLWPLAITWLIWATALAAWTPLSLVGSEHLATLESAQLRGVSTGAARLSAWGALCFVLLRLFVTRSVLVSLLTSLRASSWFVSLPLSIGLATGIGCLLCLALALLRALSHAVSPEHPRRLFALALLLPPLLGEFMPELPTITGWCASLASKGARLLGI